MEIKVKDLKHALEVVKPGLADNEFIDQITSFAFLDGKLVTYNDEISISYKVPELKGITGAVPAQSLYNFVSKIKKKEMKIEIEDKEMLLKAGNSRVGLIFDPEVRLPLEEVEGIGKFTEVSDEFVPAVKLVYPIAARDMSDPILTGVRCNDRIVEATDGHRVIQWEVSKKFPFEFIVPAAIMRKVINQNIIAVANSDGWVHFRTQEEAIISCRVLEGEWPKTSKIIEGFKKAAKIKLPKTMKEVIDRARTIVAKEKYMEESLDVTIKKGRIEIKGDGDDGWFEERQRIDYDGKPLSFRLTPTLLLGIISDSNRTCKLNKERSKLVFQKGSWTFLTMLRKPK